MATPQSIDRALATCLEEQRVNDALDLMAAWDHHRGLVWWGCLSAWSCWRPEPGPQEDRALQYANQWVETREDAARRVAGQAIAETASVPANLLLKAVFYSGGSISGEDQPAVEPSPQVCGKFILALLHHLLAGAPLPQRPAQGQRFIELARQTLAAYGSVAAPAAYVPATAAVC